MGLRRAEAVSLHISSGIYIYKKNQSEIGLQLSRRAIARNPRVLLLMHILDSQRVALSPENPLSASSGRLSKKTLRLRISTCFWVFLPSCLRILRFDTRVKKGSRRH